MESRTATECCRRCGPSQGGIEKVVDQADEATSPDGEQGGLEPVAGEAEIEGDGSPDQDGSEGGDHGHDSGEDGPEQRVGDAEDPIGQASERSWRVAMARRPRAVA